MPLLDLRVVLTNPMLLDTFSVTRRAETVSNSGESQIASVLFKNVRGIVTPIESKLKRDEDSDRVSKGITIETNFFLRGITKDNVSQDYKPDIVSWSGNSYLVSGVEDWSRYAAGFVAATCELYDYKPTPPVLSFNVATNPNLSKLSILSIIQVSATQLTLSPIPNSNNLMLFKNGLILTINVDYSIQNGTVTLNIPLSGNDKVIAFG